MRRCNRRAPLPRARAAAPAAGGKHPDALLYALEASGRPADPASLAHSLPICNLATAVWESWVPLHAISAALGHADDSLRRAVTPWQVVAGPVAAAIASAFRIGWSWLGGLGLTDDVGQRWMFAEEPPAAIRMAVVDSVRRWRFARIARSLSLKPAFADVVCPADVQPIVVDASTGSPLAVIGAQSCGG